MRAVRVFTPVCGWSELVWEVANEAHCCFCPAV
jgi:hypothetical protein